MDFQHPAATRRLATTGALLFLLSASVTLPLVSHRPGSVKTQLAAVSTPTTPAVTTCGIGDLAAVEGPPPSSTPSPTAVLKSTSGIVGFAVGNNEIATLEGSGIVVTGLAGTPIRSVPVTTLTYPSSQSSILLGPDGTTYITGVSSADQNRWVVEAFSTAGTLSWKYLVPGISDGIYSWTGSQGAFEIGVVVRGDATGELLDENGTVVGSGPVPASSTTSILSPVPSGGLLDAAGG